ALPAGAAVGGGAGTSTGFGAEACGAGRVALWVRTALVHAGSEAQLSIAAMASTCLGLPCLGPPRRGRNPAVSNCHIIATSSLPSEAKKKPRGNAPHLPGALYARWIVTAAAPAAAPRY